MHSRLERGTKQAGELGKACLIGLYIRNLGAIPLGAFIIFVLNLVTPLEFLEVQRAFIFAQGVDGM